MSTFAADCETLGDLDPAGRPKTKRNIRQRWLKVESFGLTPGELTQRDWPIIFAHSFSRLFIRNFAIDSISDITAIIRSELRRAPLSDLEDGVRTWPANESQTYERGEVHCPYGAISEPDEN